MSKMKEYLESAVGYDSMGKPASTTQITFGTAPFSVGENEDIGEIMNILSSCSTDAIVDIQIIDDVAKVSFDFSFEPETFTELSTEIDAYKEQVAHVNENLAKLTKDRYIAEKMEDIGQLKELDNKLRGTTIPFMYPSIMPVQFDGTVQIGFQDDPKFIFFSSDRINETPLKLILIYDANCMFAEDEVAIYNHEAEDELQAELEEAWFLQEQKKMDEAYYQSQYGYDNDLYRDEEEQSANKKLKGVKFKS